MSEQPRKIARDGAAVPPLIREEPERDPGVFTVSNFMSLSRIPLGLVFLVTNDPRVLAAVVVAAAATDFLDGVIARLSGTMSKIGLLLDPLCDKVFVLLGLVSFLPGSHLDWAALLVLLLRDIFTAGSYLLGRAVGRLIPFHSRFPGKVATSLQLLTLLALIFWPPYVPLLVIVVGVASVYSIVDYGMSALREQQRGAMAG